MKIRIQVLVEDQVGAAGVDSEHGLSLLVQVDAQRWLFDTGQSGLVLRNSSVLGADLSALDGVILSHGHYDHTGGLAALLQEHGPLTVHAHPGLFTERFSLRDEFHPRAVGCPAKRDELAHRGGRLVFVHDPAPQIAQGVFVVGGIPRTSGIHAEPFLVVRRQDRFVSDPFEDELMMLVRSPTGLVLLLGCCHAGLINSLNHARALFPGQPIRAVVGGLHLRSTDADDIGLVLDRLQTFDPALVAAGHCTGVLAEEALRRRLGRRFIPLRAGRILEL